MAIYSTELHELSLLVSMLLYRTRNHVDPLNPMTVVRQLLMFGEKAPV